MLFKIEYRYLFHKDNTFLLLSLLKKGERLQLVVIHCVHEHHFNPRSLFLLQVFLEVCEIYLHYLFLLLLSNVGDFLNPYGYDRMMFGL